MIGIEACILVLMETNVESEGRPTGAGVVSRETRGHPRRRQGTSRRFLFQLERWWDQQWPVWVSPACGRLELISPWPGECPGT